MIYYMCCSYCSLVRLLLVHPSDVVWATASLCPSADLVELSSVQLLAGFLSTSSHILAPTAAGSPDAGGSPAAADSLLAMAWEGVGKAEFLWHQCILSLFQNIIIYKQAKLFSASGLGIFV